MNNNFIYSQAHLLNFNGVLDRQAHEGVCFSLASEWCLCIQNNRNFSTNGSSFFPMISRQRAYSYTWSQKVKDLGDNPSYQAFFGEAEPPSHQFMLDLARHENAQCTRQTALANRTALMIQIRQSIAAGRSCILGLWGTDGTANWGHAVAYGRSNANGNNRSKYFDSNVGQFSWPANTSTIRIATDITDRVYNDYGAGTSVINNFTFYFLT